VVKIAVLRETTPGEARVSASPETVKKFIALGATVSVENEAGAGVLQKGLSCEGLLISTG
jgi:NAD(P) transhydrogenase subunit alpha